MALRGVTQLGGTPAPNHESLDVVFQVMTDEAGRLPLESLEACLGASGARFLPSEIEKVKADISPNNEPFNKAMLLNANASARKLNEEWEKLEPEVPKDDAYAQTVAALKVLAQSYGKDGMIDVFNTKIVLTTCGDEMTDEEFDECFSLVEASTKGAFNGKKLLQAYCDAAVAVGRTDAVEKAAAATEVLTKYEEENKLKKAQKSDRVTVAAPPPSTGGD
jgi:Ca2+-binding EF-hand superfamily protein